MKILFPKRQVLLFFLLTLLTVLISTCQAETFNELASENLTTTPNDIIQTINPTQPKVLVTESPTIRPSTTATSISASITQENTPEPLITPTSRTPISSDKENITNVSLAFVIGPEKGEENGIWIYSGQIDESRLVFEVPSDALINKSMTLRPDKNAIGFLLTDDDGTAIWELDLLNGETRKLTSTFTPNIDVNFLGWSPDQNWLYIHNIDNSITQGSDTYLSFNIQSQDALEVESSNVLAWSPTVTNSYLRINQEDDNEYSLFLDRINGESQHIELPRDEFFKLFDWSLDGNKLLVSFPISSFGQNSSPSFYQLDLLTGSYQFMFKGDTEIIDANWSPNSHWIVVVKNNELAFFDTNNLDFVFESDPADNNFPLIPIGWLDLETLIYKSSDKLFVVDLGSSQQKTINLSELSSIQSSLDYFTPILFWIEDSP
jgi:hypothetical protein